MIKIFDDSASPEIPRLLSLRFRRQRAELFMPFVWLIFFGAIAWAGATLVTGLPTDQLGWWLFAGWVLCGLCAVGLAWYCVYYSLLRFTPLSILEISEQPFVTGKGAQAAVIHPGTRGLRLVRVRLVCSERTTTWFYSAPNKDMKRELMKQVSSKVLHTMTILEERHIRPDGPDGWRQVCDFTLPKSVRESYDDDEPDKRRKKRKSKDVNREIIWQIVLTIQNRMFIRHSEAFDVTVVGC